MFSYKNFLRSCLLGQKEKLPDKEIQKIPYIALHRLHTGKQIELNCLEFSDREPDELPLIHSPQVPELPYLATRKKKFSLKNTQNNENIESEAKEKPSYEAKEFKPKNYKMNVVSPLPSTEAKSPSCLPIKVSVLNTNYQSYQPYIMGNIEKAKKFLPISFDRKKFRNTSMSISHTPISRNYSPRSFPQHKENLKELQRTSGDITRVIKKTDIEIQGKKTGKSVISKPLKYKAHDDLYDLLMKFIEKVDMYKRKFLEIDRARKGYLLLEDLKYYCEAFQVSDNTEKKYKNDTTSYNKPEVSIKLASKAFKLLKSVSNRAKVSQNDFLSLCAIYQHNGGELQKFELKGEMMIIRLENLLEELRGIFELYAENNKISKQHLQGMTQFLKPTEDVMKAESVVLSQPIDFSWFLRCVPYFLFIHVELLDKSFE